MKEFQPSIKQLLKEEIASRYYYRAGTIEANLQEDKQVEKALSIINNEEFYTNILVGKVERDNVEAVKND